jgi:zinc protease
MSSRIPRTSPRLRSGGSRTRAKAPVWRGAAAVTERRLRNGLRVLVAERHADPVVAALLYYRVGSKNETEREAGVSHFLEHMMFKGSAAFGKGEVDRVTAALGGSNNAFTGNDHTAYWFELASDRWETALEIEADRMRNLLLDPREFVAEREVVLEELAMGEDDPWRVLMKDVEAVLFPRHPYGRPIIGYAETLRALKVGDMRDYYQRFYHPANATLVVCGDVTPPQVARVARRAFGAIAPGVAYAEADAFRAPVQELGGETRIKRVWDDAGKRLVTAWQTVRFGTDDDNVLDVIHAILTSGRASRLQRRLVHDEGLATSISASNDTRVEGGAFWVFAECAQGADPEALERALGEEIAHLATTRVRQAELERAKAILRASDAFDGETVTDLAEDLGEWAVDGDWRQGLELDRRMARITAADVQDAARRLLVPHARVVGWSLPRS